MKRSGNRLKINNGSRAQLYEELLPQIYALTKDEKDFTANLANIASALKYGMNFFWVGFYLVKENNLILGPFQGPVACTRIAYGKGVCGKSWETKQAIVVKDVHLFPGHIACHAASRSEIVIPAFNASGEVFLVLDADSEFPSHFNQTDLKYLTHITELVSALKKKNDGA